MFFSGANGFPCSSYNCILKNLECQRVEYIDLMGHKIAPNKISWNSLSDEAIAAIESSDGLAPVIGLGHSTGAMVMLMSAAKRPDLFSRLILLEPLLMGTVGSLSIAMSRASGFRYGYKAPNVARRRKNKWSSKDAALEYFVNRPIFSQFNQQCLEDYIEYGTRYVGDEAMLSFSNETESAIFASIPVFEYLSLEGVDVIAVCGERSDILPLVDYGKWKQRISQMIQIAVPGGHLFPFENPRETTDLINSLLGSGDARDLIQRIPDHAGLLQLESGSIGKNISKNEIIVDLTAKEVGEWLVDISNWSKLNPSIADFSYLNRKAEIEDSTFKYVSYETGNKMPFLGRIIRYECGKQITVKLQHSAINVIYDYQLTAQGKKTKVEASISFELKGLYKMLGFLWGPSVRQSFTIQLAGQLKILRNILGIKEEEFQRVL